MSKPAHMQRERGLRRKRAKRKRPRKYPDSFNVDMAGFEAKLNLNDGPAVVKLRGYKSAILMSMVSGDPKVADAIRVLSPGWDIAGVAWLYGDEFDELIAMLTAAKKVWLKAYRKANGKKSKRT